MARRRSCPEVVDRIFRFNQGGRLRAAALRLTAISSA